MFDVHNKYFHQDLARQGVLCATNPDTVFKISGGEIVLNYNDETTIKGVRPYSTDGSISDFDNVVFIRTFHQLRTLTGALILEELTLLVSRLKAKKSYLIIDSRNQIQEAPVKPINSLLLNTQMLLILT